MPLVNYIPCFCQPCSAPELELFTPEDCGICSKKPGWVEPMPSLICVNPKVFTGHTPLVIHQVGFDTEIIFILRSE